MVKMILDNTLYRCYFNMNNPKKIILESNNFVRHYIHLFERKCMMEFQESEIQYSKWERLAQGSKMHGRAIAAALLSGFIPESSPGTHKVQASTELNQIRSAKRSFLGSAFRARKRDSAATFPITLLYGVRRVIRPASCIPSIYV